MAEDEKSVLNKLSGNVSKRQNNVSHKNKNNFTLLWRRRYWNE